MVGTLLETTPPGRAWPQPRDSMALLLSGLRARSGQDQRFSTSASLRLAALLGCAVYLVFAAVNFALYGMSFVKWHRRLHLWTASQTWIAALLGLAVLGLWRVRQQAVL